jgi:hypothetical protein
VACSDAFVEIQLMNRRSGTTSIGRVGAMIAATAFVLIPANVQARDGAKVAHWVVGRMATEGIAIDPVSGERKSLGKEWAAGSRWRPVTQPPQKSPDGMLVAFVGAHDAVPPQRAAGLCVAKLNARAEGMLVVPAAEAPRDFTWTPDSKSLICAQGAERRTQVYRIDIDFKTNPQVRLSDGKDMAFDPQVSPDGAIAWLALRDEKGKQNFIDLMVLPKSGEQPRALVERADITAYAFSPDGAKIAWSTHNHMTIIDAISGRRLDELEFAKRIDERMYAHHAHSIAWSPDGGSLAAAIRFSGGRSAPIGGNLSDMKPMFGDREVFIIPLDPAHKVAWFTLDDDCVGVGWIAKP